MSKGSPRHLLLNEVMEAIAKLRELEGSTPKRIGGQVEAILSKKRMQLQRDTSHITRALQQGVRAGLITRSRGKYKLGLAKRDYDVFRNLSTMVRDAEVYREHRRRGRRSGRRRRRRGRGRRRTDWEEDTDDNISEMSQDTASSFGTPIPEDRGRRRRRRGRRRRSGRRGRRGRRHAVEDDSNKSEKASEDKKQLKKLEQKSSNDSVKSSGSQSEFNRNKNEIDQDDENLDDLKDNENKLNCDNPECLCNIMPSGENKHENRKSK